MNKKIEARRFRASKYVIHSVIQRKCNFTSPFPPDPPPPHAAKYEHVLVAINEVVLNHTHEIQYTRRHTVSYGFIYM
jgi:hypothetical protein